MLGLNVFFARNHGKQEQCCHPRKAAHIHNAPLRRQRLVERDNNPAPATRRAEVSIAPGVTRQIDEDIVILAGVSHYFNKR